MEHFVDLDIFVIVVPLILQTLVELSQFLDGRSGSLTLP